MAATTTLATGAQMATVGLGTWKVRRAADWLLFPAVGVRVGSRAPPAATRPAGVWRPRGAPGCRSVPCPRPRPGGGDPQRLDARIDRAVCRRLTTAVTVRCFRCGAAVQAGPGEVQAAVLEAIKRGYRHLDCACDYGNEQEVGAGIKAAIDAGLCTRDELFVTSKLWNTYHAKEHVELACRKTLDDLGLDYVDLYLIHFPISLKFVPIEKRYPPEWVNDPDDPELNKMILSDVPISETWAAMEELQSKGLAKAIGVSNFSCQSLMDLLKYCKTPPAVNQVELHPYNVQSQLLTFCKSRGITVTGFSPLGARSYSWLDGTVQGALLEDPVVTRIAASHSKSPAQICIRWQVQRCVRASRQADRRATALRSAARGTARRVHEPTSSALQRPRAPALTALNPAVPAAV